MTTEQILNEQFEPLN